PFKPATDVVLVGSAYSSPESRHEVDVRLRMGKVDKSVRVFGDRRWEKALGVVTRSEAQRLERVPLTFERAFGGTDDSMPEQIEWEPRNPVGAGFRARKSRLPVDGAPLPNLEDPRRLMRHHGDRLEPSAFGFVCPHWDPRLRYAGTYDEAWTRTRAPFLPADFDPRFYQTVSLDQVHPGYLQGGEQVEV